MTLSEENDDNLAKKVLETTVLIILFDDSGKYYKFKT